MFRLRLRVWRVQTLAFAVCLYSSCLRADVILDWTALTIDCIRADNTSPTVSTRNLAILHTAIYDSVNAIIRTGQPYRFQPDPPVEADPEAAAAAAARRVILSLYPSFRARADRLFDAWLDANPLPSSPSVTNGIALGEAVAALSLDGRRGDGASTEVPYIPSDLPGQWQRTPPLFRPPLTPQWRYVDPFCVPEIESFQPPPPPRLDSAEYAAALNEVKSIGGVNSTSRTADQTQIAVFWSDFSYTAMPPGHWHEITATIARDRGNSLVQNARLFALISLAQADTAIVCWETKYRHNLWRPITAVHRADEDGNRDTEPDRAWEALLAAPPFPAYTSGHSSFGKASATILTRFYGTDAIAFDATSDSLPGVVRSFTSLATCADEIGMSRIYGGIHYRFDNVAGKWSGERVAEHVFANFLLPSEQLPLLRIASLGGAGAELRLLGRIGTSYILEASSDLVHWQPLSTNVAAIGGTVVFDSRDSAGAAWFYRATNAR